jgi:hypothetical protein
MGLFETDKLRAITRSEFFDNYFIPNNSYVNNSNFKYLFVNYNLINPQGGSASPKRNCTLLDGYGKSINLNENDRYTFEELNDLYKRVNYGRNGAGTFVW